MLFVRSGLRPGSTVLVQGASGGVATALIKLGSAAGYRMWVTGRNEEKRTAALALGADQAFETGARLPGRVDGVMESVGEATWSHSIKSLKPGGVVVTCGATTGFNPGAELNRVFFTQLSVIGSTMGTRDELESLISMCRVTGVRPQIDVELPLTQAAEGFARMHEGRTAGKIVFTV
jgi:NADPH:quinone reductase-like Zn-dependent oxidoreductase